MSDVPALAEGPPYPLGATVGRAGVNFAAVLGPCDQGRALPVRRRRRDARSSASNCPSTPTRSGTATCPSLGRGTVYGYRVHGPYEPDAGPSLQSEQAAARSLRASSTSASCAGARSCSATRIGHADDDLTLRRARQRALRAEVPASSIRAFTWGARPRAADAVGAHHHLRDARARLHQAPSRGARAAARHLRRPRACARGARLHPLARRHRGRAAADPRPSSTTATCSTSGLRNYWGYNTHRLLRAGAALPSDAAATRRVQGDGRRASTTPASR